MPLAVGISPKLVRAGRRDWPSRVLRISPWVRGRTLERHEVWFLWRGRGTVKWDGGHANIGAGGIFWFQPGRFYEVDQDPEHPLGLTYLVFDLCDRRGRPVSVVPPPPSRLADIDASLAESLTRRIIELLWEGYLEGLASPPGTYPADCLPQPYFTDEDELARTSPFSPITIGIDPPADTQTLPAARAAHRLFQAFYGELAYLAERPVHHGVSGLEKRHRQMVAAVALQMQQSPCDIKSVADIAHGSGYSTDHFTRTFKKIMGCSPQQYLVNARVARAKYMLVGSALSIKEIADQLGYCNAYFFSRQFKAFTSLSPSLFRERFHRQDLPS